MGEEMVVSKKNKPKKAALSSAPEKSTLENNEEEIMSFLSPKREVDLKIKKAFEEADDVFSVILALPKEDYETCYTRLAKYITEGDSNVIYVTMNKDSSDLIRELEKEKVDLNKVVFVDAVTKMISGRQLQGKQFTYLDSPSNLLEIIIAVEKEVKKVPEGKAFVIFDSINTLLIYNPEVVVEKFIHSLSQKTKDWGCKSVFLATKGTNEAFVSALAQFFDDILSL